MNLERREGSKKDTNPNQSQVLPLLAHHNHDLQGRHACRKPSLGQRALANRARGARWRRSPRHTGPRARYSFAHPQGDALGMRIRIAVTDHAAATDSDDPTLQHHNGPVGWSPAATAESRWRAASATKTSLCACALCCASNSSNKQAVAASPCRRVRCGTLAMHISLEAEHACKRVKCNYLLDSSALYQEPPFIRRRRLAPVSRRSDLAKIAERQLEFPLPASGDSKSEGGTGRIAERPQSGSEPRFASDANCNA